MWAKLNTLVKNLDWWLLTSVVVLVCFGLAEVYSVSYSQGTGELGNFKKQLLAVILGLVVMFVLILADYYFFYSYNNYFYLAAILMLVAVLIFGRVVNSTKGWFSLFSLNFQPVELVKLLLLIFLARYFSGVSLKQRPFKHLFLSGTGVGILMLLIMLQPDFGSAIILFAVWFCLLIFIGFPRKYLTLIVLAMVVSFALGWQFFLKPYQKNRILSFVAPISSLSRDYNVNQAIIAVGAGGWLGRGLGFGSQSQLKFLPEAKNDFMFAVISEELGFLGVGIVLFFFGLILFRLLKNLPKIKDDFGVFFLLGAAILIFIEMFTNIGMNMGLLPVVGIGLPFLSYGGSAMLSNLMIVGIAESIIVRSKIKNY